MKVAKAGSQKTTQKSPAFFWSLVIIFLIFTALCIYKPKALYYSVFDRSWGFDHITCYGTSAKFLFFFACAVLIIPYSNNFLRLALTWFTDKLTLLHKQKILLFLLFSALSVVVFYLLTVKYFFLGDFNVRLLQTMKKEFVATEYLTMRLLYSFATLGARYGFTNEQMFKIYSYLTGGAFVFISFLIADLSAKTVFQKTLFFFAQISSALLLVFCGYVEIYATPIVLLSLYLYSGLRYLKFNKGFAFVLLSLALAVASHLLCLAAVPSLVILWYFTHRRNFSFLAKMSNTKIALWLSVLIIFVLIVAFKSGNAFLLSVSPPIKQPKLLTLFSVKHFWELFNGEVLSCGLSIIFIFLLFIKSIREKKSLLPEHYFLISVTGCFLLLISIANLQRGSGDWDIMAFPSVGMNLLTLMLISHLFKNEILNAQYLMIALTGLNAIHAFLWLQINHTDRSIQKIEKMLVNDPGTYYTARISGVIQLTLVYKNNNLPHEAQRAALIACNAPGLVDIRPCVMYGLGLKDAKKLEEAHDFFEDLLMNRSPYVYEPYLYMLEYYEKKKDYVKFDFYLDKFFDSFIQDPNAFINNVNFKPDFPIVLFEALYKSNMQVNNKLRAEQIRSVIDGLKSLKRKAIK